MAEWSRTGAWSSDRLLRLRAGNRRVAAGWRELARPLGTFQLCGKDDAPATVEVVGNAADLSRPERTRDFAVALPDFAAALREFEGGRWATAAARFDRVLAARPLDGPASFYRKWCELYLQGTAASSAHGAIRLESK